VDAVVGAVEILPRAQVLDFHTTPGNLDNPWRPLILLHHRLHAIQPAQQLHALFRRVIKAFGRGASASAADRGERRRLGKDLGDGMCQSAAVNSVSCRLRLAGSPSRRAT